MLKLLIADLADDPLFRELDSYLFFEIVGCGSTRKESRSNLPEDHGLQINLCELLQAFVSHMTEGPVCVPHMLNIGHKPASLVPSRWEFQVPVNVLHEIIIAQTDWRGTLIREYVRKIKVWQCFDPASSMTNPCLVPQCLLFQFIFGVKKGPFRARPRLSFQVGMRLSTILSNELSPVGASELCGAQILWPPYPAVNKSPFNGTLKRIPPDTKQTAHQHNLQVLQLDTKAHHAATRAIIAGGKLQWSLRAFDPMS